MNGCVRIAASEKEATRQKIILTRATIDGSRRSVVVQNSTFHCVGLVILNTHLRPYSFRDLEVAPSEKYRRRPHAFFTKWRWYQRWEGGLKETTMCCLSLFHGDAVCMQSDLEASKKTGEDKNRKVSDHQSHAETLCCKCAQSTSQYQNLRFWVSVATRLQKRLQKWQPEARTKRVRWKAKLSYSKGCKDDSRKSLRTVCPTLKCEDNKDHTRFRKYFSFLYWRRLVVHWKRLSWWRRGMMWYGFVW